MLILHLFTIFLTIVVHCHADPQVFWLNSYNSGTNSYALDVESGGKLYLASSDDTFKLQQIQIVNGATSITLDKLQNGLTLTSNVITLKSSIDQKSAQLVTGFLYATTRIQANDPNFTVEIVNGPRTLSNTGTGSTTVILNTKHWEDFPAFDAPEKTTYVTEIEQFSTTKLNFHYDFPSVNYTFTTINQFFENPQTAPNFDYVPPKDEEVFFKDIQPLQINLPYWYITASGPFNMKVDNVYMGVHKSFPTSENTTGLFVVTDIFMEQEVHFKVDNSKERHVGFLISSFITYEIGLYLTGGTRSGSFSQTYTNQQKLWHANIGTVNDGDLLTLNATSLAPGIFYAQYYVFNGKTLPTDAPTTTTTTTSTLAPTTVTTVQTSTKGAGRVVDVWVVVMSVLVWTMARSL